MLVQNYVLPSAVESEVNDTVVCMLELKATLKCRGRTKAIHKLRVRTTVRKSL